MSDPDPDLMRRMAALLRPAQQLLEQKPPEVQVGSLLHKLDERLGGPYLISSAVAAAQVQAADHLVASSNLLFKARSMHPWASMTMARGALENAAVAAWLLISPEDDVRCLRALRLHCQNHNDHVQFTDALGGPPDRLSMIRERRQRAVVRAQELGLDAGLIGKGVYWSTILREVGANLEPDQMSPFLMWKLLSGLAHGREWASVEALSYRELEDRPHDSVLVEFTPKETHLFVALAMAVELLTVSRKHQDHDRLAWRDHASQTNSRSHGTEE